MARKTKSKKPTSTSTQVDVQRDARGRFVKGYKPKTTLRDRPQDRYDITKPENINPQHSPRMHLRRLWNLPRDEVKKRIMTLETAKNMTYGEYLALVQASRARKTSRDFEITMNQAEGSPIQPIDMDVKEEKVNPYDNLTEEELRKLLGE